jgi:hypothetical protein
MLYKDYSALLADGTHRNRGIASQVPTGPALPRILQDRAATMRFTGAGTTPDTVPALAIVQRAAPSAVFCALN